MANYVVSGGKLGDPQVESGVISSGAAEEEDLSLAAAGSGAVFSVDSGERDRLAAAAVQYVYLDFDGEETRYRNRDLGLDFAVTVKDSGFSDDEKQDILSALTAGHPDVVFTLDKPENETTEYSTVFIGKSGDFEGYGTFLGLAENIDIGNQIKNDNAFVLLDRTADLSQVISVTDHELGHIVLGQKHDMRSESLYDYAASLVSSQTTTLTIKVSRSGGTTPGHLIISGKKKVIHFAF